MILFQLLQLLLTEFDFSKATIREKKCIALSYASIHVLASSHSLLLFPLSPLNFLTTRFPIVFLCEPRHGPIVFTSSSPSATTPLWILSLLFCLPPRRPARRPLLGARASPTPLLIPTLLLFVRCDWRTAWSSSPPILSSVFFWSHGHSTPQQSACRLMNADDEGKRLELRSTFSKISKFPSNHAATIHCCMSHRPSAPTLGNFPFLLHVLYFTSYREQSFSLELVVTFFMLQTVHSSFAGRAQPYHVLPHSKTHICGYPYSWFLTSTDRYRYCTCRTA